MKSLFMVRKKESKKECTEITIKYTRPGMHALQNILGEIRDLKKEYPDASINVEIIR